MRTKQEVNSYPYEHVTSKTLVEDMNFSERAPRPGEPFPTFDLPTTDGVRFRTQDIAGRKPMLLITGSFTCPMTASSNPKLKGLHDRFGRDIQFVMLHVREAHPGEYWDQPRSPTEKMGHARALKDRDGLPWPIVVDDVDGRVHRSLDQKPNAAYLVDRNGWISFRALWAGDEALLQALASVSHVECPRKKESRRRLVPMAEGLGVMRDMMRQAGPRASRDIWLAAPPMAALAWTADLYRPLPPKWRAAAGLMTVGCVTIGLIAMLARTRSQRT